MKTVMKLIRKNNAVSFLAENKNTNATIFNAEGFFYWLSCFALEIKEGVHYKAGASGNSEDVFIDRCIERYPDLNKLPFELVKVYLLAALRENPYRNKLYTHHSRTVVLWLTFPEHLDKAEIGVDYLCTLMCAGEFVTPDSQLTNVSYIKDTSKYITTLMAGAERVREIARVSYGLEHLEDPGYISFSVTTLHIVAIAAYIEQHIGKAPDFKYLRTDGFLATSLLSLGYTHRELFETFTARTTQPEATQYIYHHANGDFIRQGVETLLEQMAETYRSSVGVLPHSSGSISSGCAVFTHLSKIVLLPNKNDFDEAIQWTLGQNLDEYVFQWLFQHIPTTDSPVKHLQIFRWVTRHRQWMDDTTKVEAYDGSVISVHNHTIIELMVRHSTEEMVQGLQPTDTPSVIEFVFQPIFKEYVDDQVKNRIMFVKPELTLKDITCSNGEQVSFTYIEDSVTLSNEGRKMSHCIGGYGQRMNEDSAAFHVNSSANKHGYTLHAVRDEKTKLFKISELRGHSNKALPEVTYKAIENHLIEVQG